MYNQQVYFPLKNNWFYFGNFYIFTDDDDDVSDDYDNFYEPKHKSVPSKWTRFCQSSIRFCSSL